MGERADTGPGAVGAAPGVGPAVGRRPAGAARWTAADIPDQRGRTVIVTGASSGLGAVTARELARAGARVIPHAGGKLIFHLFASLAEFERDLIRERTHAGLTAARARGRNGGRPKGVDEKKRKAAVALKRDPQYSIREICEIVGISRNTYYKYTRE